MKSFETSQTDEISIFVPSEFQIQSQINQDTGSEQFENTDSRVELRTSKWKREGSKLPTFPI